jgi:hypothetical protein
VKKLCIFFAFAFVSEQWIENGHKNVYNFFLKIIVFWNVAPSGII